MLKSEAILSLEEPSEFIPCVSFVSFSTQASWLGHNDVHFCPSTLLRCRHPLHQNQSASYVIFKSSSHVVVESSSQNTSSHVVVESSSQNTSSHVVFESSSHVVFESSSHVVFESSSHVVFESSSHVYSNLRHMLYSNPSVTRSTSNPS